MQQDTANLNPQSPDSRLEWACRRGMLELDLLLGKFLKEVYPSLPNIQKTQFVELLSCSDPDLFSWLLGEKEPAESHYQALVERIKEHARTHVQI